MGVDVASRVLTDQALLERFLNKRDEDAFAELVARHGPMVRATCWRYLGNTPEVDDAFQAVFLVLVRKARRITSRDLLGPWLYTVAVRAARRVLAGRQRRQSRERSVNPMPEPTLPGPAEPNDWLPLLDDALHSLPDKYRVPLILCELEGQSREEAAEHLALPEGTLSSRLARGRDLLRQRLVRRGLAVSVTVLTGALATPASALPPALLASTTQMALTGQAAASVAALTQGVLHAMFMSKLKLFVGVFAALALVATGGILAWPAISAQDQGAKAKSDQELLQGTWRVVSAKIQGKDLDAQEADEITMGRFVFKGEKVHFKAEFPCDYKLNPAKSPKEIDVIPREGPPGEKDQTFAGIYELKGKDLRICVAHPGQARPANFDDPMSMLFVLKRAKD